MTEAVLSVMNSPPPAEVAAVEEALQESIVVPVMVTTHTPETCTPPPSALPA